MSPFKSKNNILPKIKLRRGIAENRDHIGGGPPFYSRQTIIRTELFYAKWITDRLTEPPSINTNGLRFFLEHDNTDYPKNPPRGHAFTATTSLDFGLANSTQSWNALDFDYKHYAELRTLSWMSQRVLAFNA